MIILGVRDKNVEYMMNDAATVIAFVQEGEDVYKRQALD